MRDGFFGVCLQCSLRLAPAADVALAVFGAVRCLVGPGFEVLCLGSGALRTDSWMRSGCWLARDRACARRKAQGVSNFRAVRDGFLVVCLQCSLRLAPAAAVALAVFGAVRCFWVSWGKGFLVVASLLDGCGKSPRGLRSRRCAPESTAHRHSRCDPPDKAVAGGCSCLILPVQLLTR